MKKYEDKISPKSLIIIFSVKDNIRTFSGCRKMKIINKLNISASENVEN